MNLTFDIYRFPPLSFQLYNTQIASVAAVIAPYCSPINVVLNLDSTTRLQLLRLITSCSCLGIFCCEVVLDIVFCR